jgi:hypothetical protein
VLDLPTHGPACSSGCPALKKRKNEDFLKRKFRMNIIDKCRLVFAVLQHFKKSCQMQIEKKVSFSLFNESYQSDKKVEGLEKNIQDLKFCVSQELTGPD